MVPLVSISFRTVVFRVRVGLPEIFFSVSIPFSSLGSSLCIAPQRLSLYMFLNPPSCTPLLEVTEPIQPQHTVMEGYSYSGEASVLGKHCVPRFREHGCISLLALFPVTLGKRYRFWFVLFTFSISSYSVFSPLAESASPCSLKLSFHRRERGEGYKWGFLPFLWWLFFPLLVCIIRIIPQ